MASISASEAFHSSFFNLPTSVSSNNMAGLSVVIQILLVLSLDIFVLLDDWFVSTILPHARVLISPRGILVPAEVPVTFLGEQLLSVIFPGVMKYRLYNRLLK
jgi:hypothetical protein